MSVEPLALTRNEPETVREAPPLRTSARSRSGDHAPAGLSPPKPIARTVVFRSMRIAAAALCLALVAFGVTRFPVMPGTLAGVLAAYAVVLWYRPAAFLLILPVVLPALGATRM